MDNLNFYFSIVENAIAKIGLDPQGTRQKNPGQWTLTKGKVPVWIDIYHNEKEGRIYFQVVSPVMKMPGTKNGQLALDLLELNNQLYGVAFCTKNENVFIKTIREAEGLDMNEAYSMIMRVGNYADQYDDQLKSKYPGWVPATFQGPVASNN